MLHSLVMLVAQQTLYTILIFKIDISQDVVTLHNLVKDIEVQRQLINALNLFNKLPTYWAADSKVMVEHREALSAESVSTVDKNPRNFLPDIELFTAIVAKIKPSCFIVSLEQVLRFQIILLIIQHLLMSCSFFLESLGLLTAIIEWLTLESIGSVFSILLHFLKNL